ncbi:hypothetical protein CC85DRAFT_285869 [Cutaneotrichosporon oleaginosum]|uniref:Uncharacterized protein n=1 Tax=Cutaneotrichosporon oleaginosum TaxID=879819 RepID=A0A0J0XLX3_9TREE|nr:uncharacterized protein CC85DRAFT_285869 [Cutaneotrichosporon oleaginosum]KLT42102.1 hypothetical protein CC85DRAFT_285869 [Cutaneotrichosporon oleaginosum]TXT04659.1 hypothetical protein COLE_07478 [Cutaneotrichosporon oleaginosum]
MDITAPSGAGGSSPRLKPGRPRATTTSTQATQIASPTPTAVTTMSNASGNRKVRTVPPSAMLDPPTPTGESNPTFDTARIEHPKRRKRRFRHWTSSEESSDSDDDDEDTDDEPAWWTFTQTGVAKLRSRWNERPTPPPPGQRGSISEAHHDSGGSDAESGRESIRARFTRRRLPFSSTPPRQNSGGSTTPRARDAAARIFHPRPLRASWIRGSSTDVVETPASVNAPELPRPTSAPAEDQLKADVTLNSPDISHHDTGHDTDTPLASPTKRPIAKRFLSMPQRRSHDDTALTDSEAVGATSPRVRAKQRLWPALHGPLAEEDGNEAAAESDTGAEAAARPRHRRLNTQNLRLRIPANVSEHFAGGWPHAGSWQHALHYGLMDEDEKPRRHSTDQMRRHSDQGHNVLVDEPDNMSVGNGSMHGHGNGSAQGHASSAQGHGYRTSINDTDTSTGQQKHAKLHLDLSTIESPPRAKRKTRNRRTRRYRPAMVPPTPGAHSVAFNPERTVIGADVWGDNVRPTPDPDTNPFDRVNPFDRIDEEYPFSDDARSEKVGMFGRKRTPRPLDGLDWRKKVRRMLFLDARVTIYIRLVNLAIAATLMGLSIDVRQRVGRLALRGIIGPSTTLIIAYSCLTVVHVLTAIYREYFGRPIGLWGLRSKMLWVCLDLLFIALWSSAATLAINDYIDTPLDCTPLTPWWSNGIEYAATPRAFIQTTPVPEALKTSPLAASVCRRQIGCFVVSLAALLLYCGNMVLSLFRIFETVRRTANPIRAVSV